MGEENYEQVMYFQNHKKLLAQSVDNFLARQAFVDMTLVCSGGKKIKVHRAVLAACSPLFENILIDIDDQSHPVLVFNEISEDVMVIIIEFIYKGKTGIAPDLTDVFLSTAKKLQIRGLESHRGNLQGNSSRSPANPVNENMSDTHRRQKHIKSSPSETTDLGQNHYVQEKLPMTIKTGTGTKVLNPFAVKRLQKDSDSTSTEDDLCVPGPSKSDNEKEADSSKPDNAPEDDDSDIEFIEDNPNPSIVVIESQNTNSMKWFSKEPTNNKRAIPHRKPASDVDCDSEDSEVWTSHRKKKKNSHNLKSDDEVSSKSKPVEARNSRDTSESPELITQVELKDLPKAMVDPVKEENRGIFSEADYLQKPFQALGRYCVICKVFKKNIGLHVKRLHSGNIRRPTNTCKTCSKTFYMQHALQIHKCKG